MPRTLHLHDWLPNHNYALTLGPRQWDVFNCPTRFRVVVAGRRFGKTELSLAEINKAALAPNKIIWYVGPTDDQTKRMVWDRLKESTQPHWAKPPNETYNRITLANNTQIVVNGALKENSLRGSGLDLLVLDEFASMKPTIWRRVFRPALADRKGRALFMGTPLGRNHFFDCFERGQQEADPNWRSFHFTTADGGLVDPQELVECARDLDPDSYRQEFEAEFGSFGKHRVYATFDRAKHIQPVGFDTWLPLIWCIDFNVDPMCMVFAQLHPQNILHVIDEIVIKPNATTEMACQKFLERAKPLNDLPSTKRPLIVHIYGDSSGNQRRTASGTNTDWSIIKDFFRMWVGTFDPKYHIPSANPHVRDRVNSVRARLCNQAGEARLFINPKCKELIRDFEEVSWVTDSSGHATGEINKSDRSRTHMSDALGYYIFQYFPLTSAPFGHQPKPLPLF